MRPYVTLVDMYELPDMSDAEARATAQDRLDLHFEHQDALSVQRGRWTLAEYLRRFDRLDIEVVGRNIAGAVRSVGDDWVELNTALVRLTACRRIVPNGNGDASNSPLHFRQAVRQYAGRMPREVLFTTGDVTVVRIDWVGADFIHAGGSGGVELLPLSQVAAVFGTLG